MVNLYKSVSRSDGSRTGILDMVRRRGVKYETSEFMVRDQELGVRGDTSLIWPYDALRERSAPRVAEKYWQIYMAIYVEGS